MSLTLVSLARYRELGNSVAVPVFEWVARRTVLDRQRPTARKPHHCEGCSRTIRPGESYQLTVRVGDYGIERWKQCVQCEALVDWLYFTDDDARWCLNDGEFDVCEWLADFYPDSEIRRLYLGKWAELLDGAA